MIKGLLILSLVFVVIAMLHFFSLRVMRVSDEKKKKIAKIFWYLYGIYFAVVGLSNTSTPEGFRIFGFLQFLCGITFCVLNYKGAMDGKKTK
jgi:cytochrome c oxidase assembly factor CtaG